MAINLSVSHGDLRVQAILPIVQLLRRRNRNLLWARGQMVSLGVGN